MIYLHGLPMKRNQDGCLNFYSTKQLTTLSKIVQFREDIKIGHHQKNYKSIIFLLKYQE